MFEELSGSLSTVHPSICLQSVGEISADIERSGGLGLDSQIEGGGGVFSVKVINRLQGDVMIHEALAGRTRSSDTASRVQVLFLIE